MPKQSAAAHDTCCAGVAPTARAASRMRRMVLAKPTTTAAVDDETIPIHPPPAVPPEPAVRGAGSSDRGSDVIKTALPACAEQGERLAASTTREAPWYTGLSRLSTARPFRRSRAARRGRAMIDWIRLTTASTPPGAALLCIPFAGGGPASYAEWPADLPELDVIAASLPGRERRFREPPVRAIGALTRWPDRVAPWIEGRGYAVFGHSFGALVAFELVRALRRA